jgi:glycosyltransferase involved in cell wall biosynthesis
VIVGKILKKLTLEKNKGCPVIFIDRTQNVHELVQIYSAASVYVNPTYQDNYPTTNLEAMACGTPVVTYDTGGSPEPVSAETGMVVEQGNITTLLEAVKQVCERDCKEYDIACRKRAVEYFDKDKCFEKYIELYRELT